MANTESVSEMEMPVNGVVVFSIENGNGTERMQRDADSTFWLAPALVRMENKDDDDAGKGR